MDSTPILIEALRYPILLPARDEPTEHGLVGNLMYSVFGEWGLPRSREERQGVESSLRVSLRAVVLSSSYRGYSMGAVDRRPEILTVQSGQDESHVALLDVRISSVLSRRVFKMFMEMDLSSNDI